MLAAPLRINRLALSEPMQPHACARACRYWTLVEAEPRAWQVPKEALPSDARERADLVALARGDLKAAQACAVPALGLDVTDESFLRLVKEFSVEFEGGDQCLSLPGHVGGGLFLGGAAEGF